MKRRFLVAVAVLLIGLGVVTDRMFIHPRLAPLPPSVDAIIELGGAGMAGRDSLALELARRGHAPFLVQSTLADAVGTSRCLPPVPAVTVLCFHAEPNTTRGEARWIADEANRRHWRSVVLVTTPDQAWRARLRTTRCFDGEVYVATAPLPWYEWPRQIPYQWAATAKALILERSC
ncbi:MAG TPA: hypothetical protein VFH03_19765 [Actinoplanes sp.]|nr:hypothetical protein [Actinoplanes sp.]